MVKVGMNLSVDCTGMKPEKKLEVPFAVAGSSGVHGFVKLDLATE